MIGIHEHDLFYDIVRLCESNGCVNHRSADGSTIMVQANLNKEVILFSRNRGNFCSLQMAAMKIF